jgi:hypothetical protein
VKGKKFDHVVYDDIAMMRFDLPKIIVDPGAPKDQALLITSGAASVDLDTGEVEVDPAKAVLIKNVGRPSE